MKGLYLIHNLGTTIPDWFAVGVTDSFDIILADGHEDMVKEYPQKTFIGAGWIKKKGGVIELERYTGSVNIPVLKMVDAHAIKIDLEDYLGGRVICRR
jgi:hypothetical protein